MSLMSLGLFVFEINTAPYQQTSRDSSFNWSKQDRVGASPSYQYTGPGEDSKTISGVLLPEFTGGESNLDVLRAMADTGKAHPLLSGEGDYLGLWFIDNISDTQSYFLNGGKAQKIEFTLSLKYYGGGKKDVLSDLSEQIKGVVDTAYTPVPLTESLGNDVTSIVDPSRSSNIA